MNIPFLDLKLINDRFEKEYHKAYQVFLKKGHYVLGNEVFSFEKEFANFCGATYAIGVGNGFDALFLILKAYINLGILNHGDEIIAPGHTFIATILSIKQAGLKPVLVDADPNTFNIDVSLIKEKVTPKTKAIIATHLYGKLANMSELKEVSNVNNLVLISDAAQAHGAEDKLGIRAGNLADASSFSFYPSKNLGALGDGGAITTNDTALYNEICLLRNYGSHKKYHHSSIGVNSRLDELQAAFLRSKLPFLNIDNEYRRSVAKKYIEKITNPSIKLPFWKGSKDHVFHLFVIQCKKRDVLQKFLLEKGINTLIHYPIAIHKQEAFKDVFLDSSLPITEKLAKTVLSLPISPVITNDEVEYIIQVINSFKID